ncbi:hypothetical protein VN12_22830 [Pirellula sp. SH-Sr6A]|nr:hypothetical protein VN12_22830 [Pirellula sp. SH-Sr6A]
MEEKIVVECPLAVVYNTPVVASRAQTKEQALRLAQVCDAATLYSIARTESCVAKGCLNEPISLSAAP